MVILSCTHTRAAHTHTHTHARDIPMLMSKLETRVANSRLPKTPALPISIKLFRHLTTRLLTWESAMCVASTACNIAPALCTAPLPKCWLSANELLSSVRVVDKELSSTDSPCCASSTSRRASIALNVR
jgi:hypothetical protein